MCSISTLFSRENGHRSRSNMVTAHPPSCAKKTSLVRTAQTEMHVHDRHAGEQCNVNDTVLGTTRLRASALWTTERLCRLDSEFVQRWTQGLAAPNLPCTQRVPWRGTLPWLPTRSGLGPADNETATLVVKIQNPVIAGSRKGPPPNGGSDLRPLDACKRGRGDNKFPGQSRRFLREMSKEKPRNLPTSLLIRVGVRPDCDNSVI